MNYYPRYPAHYVAKTLHLSMEQDGAYTRLLDWYYANERPIPHAQRYAIARAQTPSERRSTDTVLQEFFALENGAYEHERAGKEIEKAQPKIQAARANGRLGGRPRKNPVASDEKPNGFSGETHGEPTAKAPQSPIPIEDQKHSAQPSATRFGEFWSAYPRKRGKKPAEAKWKAKRLDRIADELIADVRKRIASDDRWKRGFIPDPLTYLNQERWDDALTDATPAAPPPRMGPQPPSESPLERDINRALHDFRLGLIDEAERDQRIAAATAKHRGDDA